MKTFQSLGKKIIKSVKESLENNDTEAKYTAVEVEQAIRETRRVSSKVERERLIRLVSRYVSVPGNGRAFIFYQEFLKAVNKSKQQ